MCLFPFSLVLMFGRMLKQMRHAWVIFGVMMSLMILTIVWAISWDTMQPNPALQAHDDMIYPQEFPQKELTVALKDWAIKHLGVKADADDGAFKSAIGDALKAGTLKAEDYEVMAEKYKWVIARSGQAAELVDRDPRKNGADKPKPGHTPALPVDQSLGNLEGKELRFGTSAGTTFAAATTCITCGSVNCMHDSLNPLAGITPLTGMWLNCIFGGKGVGLINMLIYLIIGVFIAGLMVGRTPEYLGKKVEAREMKLAMLALLVHPILILMPTGYFAATDCGLKAMNNPGAHGFSEVLYEFSSASANNGSGFEGLGDTWGSYKSTPAPESPYWDIATALVMLLGRFLPIIAPMAMAASLAVKKPTPFTVGTMRTNTFTFACVLLGTILLIGALLFLPVAALGPVAEHFGPLPFGG